MTMEFDAPAAAAPSSPTVVGIDLGALTTKITLGPWHDHELVRNAHGGHNMPTSATFSGKHHARLLGEDAAEASRADGNTVGMLDRLLIDSLADGVGGNGVKEDALARFRRFKVIAFDAQNGEGATEGPKVYIPNMDEEYSATSLVAMLLGRVRSNVTATIARLDGKETPSNNLHFVFAVPPSYPQSTRDALMNAAYGASVSTSSVVDSSACLAAVYDRKFGDVADEKDRIILVVEMGHARTSVSILKKAGDDEMKESKEDSGDARKVEVLSTVSSLTLGAGLVDIALFDHFLSTNPNLSHHTSESLKADSRQAQRLLEGCRKLKHLLSMLPENTVTVENIGENDTDVDLSCTREMMKQLCEESVIEKLKDAIEAAMVKAGVEEVDAAEIAGGGSRIPFVRDAVRDELGKGEDFVLSRSFDDTSLAFGASLVGIENQDDEMMDAERQARREQLLESEMIMSKRDAQLRKKDEVRNHIEAHILELRSARHSKHGSLLPSSEEFASYLDGVDDWLFSEECDEATCEKMEEKWTWVQTKTEELCGEYLAAKKEAAERKDREMEEEAQKAAAEAAANGDDDEAEDHDTRRLPAKRRMEIVQKNKKEANELFSDGNYRHAAARYAKALTHCSKFFDLSPEEEKEVNATKLSLHLNMALAYLKLEKVENAHNSCNEALKLDDKNVKALYRRATVLYQKRKFDDATRDLKAAAALAPEDKAVKKLQRLVDQQVAKQKKKEKAMAKKMFG